jgi:hypothetical protein
MAYPARRPKPTNCLENCTTMSRMSTSFNLFTAAALFAALVSTAVPVNAVALLHFGPGHHHVVVSGYLSNSGQSSRDYRFYSGAGEMLQVSLTDLAPSKHSAGCGLVTMYHITFPSGSQFGMKGYSPFDGKLTERGVYHITVDVNQMASCATSGRYRLSLVRSR